MKRNLLIVLSMVAVIAAVPFLYADMHHGQGLHGENGCGFGFMGHLQHLKGALDLSDDQSSQIQTIATQVREQNAPLREEMKKNLHEAGKLLIANPSDVTGAQEILDRNSSAERQLKSNILQGVSKALGVLRPDQRTKLSEIVARRMNRG